MKKKSQEYFQPFLSPLAKASTGASEVTIVYREPVWRIPYFIGGLVNFKRILYIRAQEEMFRSWGIGPLSRLAHAIAKPAHRIAALKLAARTNAKKRPPRPAAGAVCATIEVP